MKKESINYQQQSQQQQQYQQQLVHQETNQQVYQQQQEPFYQQQQQGNEVIKLGSSSAPSVTGGGRFDFDDGGVYVGGWQDGKAHGHGICTGPKGQGEYSGSFSFGFEICGVYKWPSGAIFEGQWSNGKRHGCGVEYRGKWVYKGEWTQGYKGRYGVRASLLSSAKYEGTWANGLQDGYGSETYADSGTYQGQWLRGMRHGYGVRSSAPYGHCNVTKAALIKNQTNLSIQSLDTEGETDSTIFDSVKRDSTMRGGFVLVVKSSSSSTTSNGRRRHNSLGDKTSPSSASNQKTGFLRGLRLKKQKSTGDIDLRSNRSSSSSVASSIDSASSAPLGNKHLSRDHIDPDTISNSSFLSQEGDIADPSTTETYMGEWKNDKRSGFGICERSDGLRYEGEWYNNKKYGYGVTFFRDGSREEGKYKNNCLVTNAKKKHLFVLRSSKLRERIESAVAAARQAQQIALQKADIAISRTATARSKAEQSDGVAAQSRTDSSLGYKIAKQYGGSNVAHGLSQPDVPLRGRLSNFPSIRRGNRSGDHSVNGSRQYLDFNEPFGGRRGSFRTGSNPSISGGGGGGGNHDHQQISPSPSPTSSYNYQNQRQQQSQHSSSLQFTTGNQGLNRGPNQISQHHDFQQYIDKNQQHHQPKQQIYINNNEIDPLNDHLDHYQKLVSRYGKTSKPPLPDNILSNRFNRSQNVITANLDKVYGTSTGTSSIDSGRESGDQSDSGLKLPPVIDMSSDSTRAPTRTASLYRLPTATTTINSGSHNNARGGISSGGGGGGGGGGGSGLKRKPSLQSISGKTPIKEPMMSREEISVLSHATREHRRQEAETAERLAHNPLLYFVDPRFRDWLNRQQIIIAVIIINITLAIIFFKLLG